MTATSENNIDIIRRAIIKEACENDHLFFTRYFFRLREGKKFKVNWHHILVCEAVQKVIDGEIQNLIINIPPGSSKTELVVINLIARGLAINNSARFLHLSYSDELASLNSSTARDIVGSEEFQELWPIQLRSDTKARKRWSVAGGVIYNSLKRPGTPPITGSVYATALGGSITGFRAGHMTEGFSGCIIVDDPLKVEDSYSKTHRERANRRLVSTVKSRKANPRTPTIVIMQRLAEEDPTGFIKAGNVPGKWEHIVVPAHIDDEYVQKHIPPHLHHLVYSSERDDGGMFSYWPYKEPVKDLCELRNKDPYVYNGQYQQRPSALGGSLIKGDWFIRMAIMPRVEYRIITVDTAQKTGERNDYSVFECWGLTVDGRYALLDLIRGKWEAPELKKRAREFWNKNYALNSVFELGKLRTMYVEDKSSGTGLIQELSSPPETGVVRIPIKPIERVKDKLTEWMDAIPSIEAGMCLVPEQAPWLSDFISENESITANMTHSHDDQIDPMCDAIDILGGKKGSMNIWAKLAGANNNE